MTTPLNHDDFQALLPDYLEERGLDAATRAAADAHVRHCAECAALVADLRRIAAEAGALPELVPSRDLWAGVNSRIEAVVLPLGASAEARAGDHTDDPGEALDRAHASERDAARTSVRPQSGVFPPRTWRRMAIAASVLIAVTAGVTYTAARRSSTPRVAAADSARPASASGGAPAAATTAVRAANAARPSAEETFDREIALLRRIVDERRTELDTATIAVLERNLKVIDDAIAESRAALARDPASPFLADRLNRSYDSKLQLLRDVATLPSRS